MTAVLSAGYVLLSVWLLYVFYSAVMHFKEARDSGVMGWPMKTLAYPALGAGLALDVSVNLTFCTVLFLELPKELLVTSRLSRLQKGTGWRAKVAGWICVNLLDALDPSGCHCK
jgi:hypothetical protein